MEKSTKKVPKAVLLDFKSTSGKRGHFMDEVIWYPEEHRVIRRSRGTVRKFFGLVVKAIESKPELLELPEEIREKEQVLAYVKKHKRYWIRRRDI